MFIDNGRAVERFAQLGRRLFGSNTGSDASDAAAFVLAIEARLRENELLQSITDLGIPEQAWPQIAEYTVSVYGDGEKLDILGPVTAKDIIEIFSMTESQSVGANA